MAENEFASNYYPWLARHGLPLRPPGTDRPSSTRRAGLESRPAAARKLCPCGPAAFGWPPISTISRKSWSGSQSSLRAAEPAGKRLRPMPLTWPFGRTIILLDVWGALWQTQWSRAVSIYSAVETSFPGHARADVTVNPHAVLPETPTPSELPGKHRHRRRLGCTRSLSFTVNPEGMTLAVNRP